jgi:UDP-4-amino-4-deoxy-L-arabinose-oxoglutarate aminotransferase
MNGEFLPFCRPQVTSEDIEAVVAVLNSGWITTGSKNAALEAAFCERVGARHAVAMASATAAMHVYLHALGVGPGDEVITPSFTWVSTVNLICLLGATPVFVDVDRHTLMVDAETIAEAVTDRTRAIIPVHFAGAPLDMDPIRALCDERGIALVEDAAHSMGTLYKGKPVGNCGTAIFSLQAIKNVTSAEGGILATDDEALARRVRGLKFHGLGVDAFDRQTQGRKPQAEVLEPGFKYNLPDMCAALGLSQLHRLDRINDARRAIAEFYDQALQQVPAVIPLHRPAWPHRHGWHLYAVRIASDVAGARDHFIEEMQRENIGCGIHFRAVHEQSYYRTRRFSGDRHLPNTEWNSARILSLPLFPDMSRSDAQRVVEAMTRVVERIRLA